MAAISGGDRPQPTFGVELETSVAPSPRIADLPYTGPSRPSVYDFGAYDSPEYVAALAAYNDAYGAYIVRNDQHTQRERRRRTEQGNLTAAEAISLAAPRGLWHPKQDGSCSGPEFASHPATLAYWRAQRSHIAGMLKALVHGGMRSHDSGQCGLHVNIGTDAFGDAEHLYRFASLVVANPRWATRMAQRTHEQVSHWARIAPLTNDAERRDWAESVFRYGYASQDRYWVLNASNSGRIEFRLPRGTLRVDRFLAKVEWVAAMVEYTRDPNNAVQVTAFLHWAERSGDYPALVAFARERFAGRFDDQPVAA
jgi:hypothetical protein